MYLELLRDQSRQMRISNSEYFHFLDDILTFVSSAAMKRIREMRSELNKSVNYILKRIDISHIPRIAERQMRAKS